MNSCRTSTLLTPWAIAIAMVVGCSNASAEWTVIPAISLDTDHSSNLQLFPGEAKDSVLSNTLQGELEFANTAPNHKVRGTLGSSFTKYSGARILEDTDRIFADLAYERRLERGTVGVSGIARRDDLMRQPRFNGFLSDPDDAIDGIDDDIGIPNEDPNLDVNVAPQQLTRTRLGARTFFNYRLDERQQLRLSYNFTSRGFDSSAELIDAGFILRESKRHALQAAYTKRLSERSRLRISTRATTLDVTSRERTDTYETRVEWSGKLSESARLTSSVGVSHVTSDIGNKTGFLVGVSAENRLNWGHIRGDISRTLRPTVRGNITETDTARLSLERTIAAGWTLGIAARGTQRDRSSDSDTFDEFKRFAVGPTLSWALLRHWEVSFAYEYRWIDRDQFDSSGKDHSATIRLQYRPAGARL